jgi:EKC/KEOPS complex subunit CGI121/TPRKB
MTPNMTHESVAAHLAQHVQGSSIPFTDAALARVSDVAKIKKAYKLGSLPSAASNQANGAHNDGKRRLELSVLGAIALRGAT